MRGLLILGSPSEAEPLAHKLGSFMGKVEGVVVLPSFSANGGALTLLESEVSAGRQVLFLGSPAKAERVMSIAGHLVTLPEESTVPSVLRALGYTGPVPADAEPLTQAKQREGKGN